MAKVTRFYDEVVVPSTGREFKDIMNSYSNNSSQYKWMYSGTVEQIIISMSAGSATVMDIQIRYQSLVSDRHKLVYEFIDAPLPSHVDSSVNAPFELTSIKNKDGDLHLYIEPDVDCTLNIRIDINIERKLGL